MPRYFFNVRDKSEYDDDIGVELPDLASAREEAIHHFGETLQTYAGAFGDSEVWQITVSDQQGKDLLTFSFFMHTPANSPARSNVALRETSDA